MAKLHRSRMIVTYIKIHYFIIKLVIYTKLICKCLELIFKLIKKMYIFYMSFKEFLVVIHTFFNENRLFLF